MGTTLPAHLFLAQGFLGWGRMVFGTRIASGSPPLPPTPPPFVPPPPPFIPLSPPPAFTSDAPSPLLVMGRFAHSFALLNEDGLMVSEQGEMAPTHPTMPLVAALTNQHADDAHFTCAV